MPRLLPALGLAIVASLAMLSCGKSIDSGVREVQAAPKAAVKPLTPTEAKEVIERHSSQAKDCYERTAMRERLSGRVELALAVTSDGVVADAQVHQSQISSPALHACITEAAARWRFPVSTSGIRIVHGFEFRP